MCAKSDDRQETIQTHKYTDTQALTLMIIAFYTCAGLIFTGLILSVKSHGRVHRGGGGGQTLENLKLHYVSVEILVRTPSRSNWTPCWSSVEPSVKYADYFFFFFF